MKETINEVLWKALEYAKQDRISLIDAYSSDEENDVVRRAKRDYDNFCKLQIKLFGTSDSKLNAAIKRMKRVNLIELLASGKHFDEFVN